MAKYKGAFMKRIFCLLIALFLCCPIGGWAVDLSRLDTMVEQQRDQNILYNSVKKELSSYYGRSNFSDPQRTTGWYRVNDFLQWLKQNAPVLENEVVNIPNKQMVFLTDIYPDPAIRRSDADRYIFWIYLGARYIADVYHMQADFSRLSIQFCPDSACTLAGTGMILVDPQAASSVPAILNLGMHEATHILPYLGPQKKGTLSELATFYSQYNYGLPVKLSDATSFGDGIRDIRRTAVLAPHFNFHYEYNYFVAGILLNDQIRPQDVLSLFKKKDIYAEIAVWQTAFTLILADSNGFFMKVPKLYDSIAMNEATLKNDMPALTEEDFAKWKAHIGREFYLGKFDKSDTPFKYKSLLPNKIPLFITAMEEYFSVETGFVRLSKQQYLEKLFGAYATNKKLKRFYSRLLENLPENVLNSVKSKWPVLTSKTLVNEERKQKVKSDFANLYDAELKDALIKALADAGAPPLPPMPKGYL